MPPLPAAARGVGRDGRHEPHDIVAHHRVGVDQELSQAALLDRVVSGQCVCHHVEAESEIQIADVGGADIGAAHVLVIVVPRHGASGVEAVRNPRRLATKARPHILADRGRIIPHRLLRPHVCRTETAVESRRGAYSTGIHRHQVVIAGGVGLDLEVEGARGVGCVLLQEIVPRIDQPVVVPVPVKAHKHAAGFEVARDGAIAQDVLEYRTAHVAAPGLGRIG